jgi:putative peptidoglycan lipid II flippase
VTDHARRVGIASAIWAGSIFLSRIIGLVREQVIGRTLGASREADLYFASFTLPDFLNYLLAAGSLSIVFIPMFIGYVQRGERERGWQAFSVIANFVFLLGGLGVGVLMLLARPLAHVVAPGFDAAEIDALVRLTRIILPAQLFHIVGGLLSAVLQAQDRHFLPALAPLLYSSCIIAGGLLGAPHIGAEGFAWGVLIGSILGPFGLPFAGCLKERLRWFPLLSFRHPDLRHYLWLSFPIMLGFSIVAVDEWILKNQASYLPEGGIAYLQFGRALMKVPIGVFGMAAGVAAYPTISRLVKAGQLGEAYALLARAVRMLLVAVLGAQVCLSIAGYEAVYLIWGAGSNRFTLEDVASTATVLLFLCLGLAGWAAQTVIARGFYALGSTWLPTIVGTLVAVAAIPMYIGLRMVWGAVGLALASAVAILLYVLVLGALQRRRFARELAARGESVQLAGMLGTAARLFVALALAIAAGLGLRVHLHPALPSMDVLTVILRAALLCFAGLGVYVAAATVLGVRELRDVGAMLLRRVRRR